MNRLLLLLVFSLSSFMTVNAGGVAEYGTVSFETAINVSSKQSYLGYKLSKEFLKAHDNGINPSTSKEYLSTKLIFQRHLELLKTNAPNREIKTKLGYVEDLLNSTLELHAKSIDKEDAELILKLTNSLLEANNAVNESIIKASVTFESTYSKNKNAAKYAEVLNVSGSQRVLSQKVALFYLANNMDLFSNINLKHILMSSIEKFDKGLTTLSISTVNSKPIEDELNTALIMWSQVGEMQNEIINLKVDSNEFDHMCNLFLDSFNTLTGLYEELISTK